MNLLDQLSLSKSGLPDFRLQSSSDAVPVRIVQPSSENNHSREDLTVFFAIGLVINVVMVTTYIVWAIKQWRKNDTSKK